MIVYFICTLLCHFHTKYVCYVQTDYIQSQALLTKYGGLRLQNPPNFQLTRRMPNSSAPVSMCATVCTPPVIHILQAQQYTCTSPSTEYNSISDHLTNGTGPGYPRLNSGTVNYLSTEYSISMNHLMYYNLSCSRRTIGYTYNDISADVL